MAGSPSSSAGSSATEFIHDPGPEFDPRSAPAAPEVDEPELPVDEWDEKRIREVLTFQGECTHHLLKAGAEDTATWKQTKQDLDSIAPPLTRILNRYDMTRAAAAAGDEILLAAALGRYGIRNYTARRRILAANVEEGPRPLTGVDAPLDTGPDADEEHQRVHAMHFEAPPSITPKGARR